MKIFGHTIITIVFIICAAGSFILNSFLAAVNEGQPDADRWFGLGIVLAIIFIALAIWSWWW